MSWSDKCFIVVLFQVLVYPNVTMYFNHKSAQEFKDGPFLSGAVIEW